MENPPTTSQRLATLAQTLVCAVLVCLVCLVVQVRGRDLTPFHTKGEPREAVVVQEMVRSGAWVLPRRNGVELPSKPPFFHWLGAGVSLAVGRVDELTTRLPSVACSAFAALLVLIAGARLWCPRTGLFAALITLTSFEWQRAATSARVDMTLAAGTTLAFVALLLFRTTERRAWMIAYYAGISWAVLAKGPLAAAPPVAALIVLCVIDLSPRWLRGTHTIFGLVAATLLASFWYVLAYREGGWDFIAKQVLFENLHRISGGAAYSGGHQHSVGYLLGALLLGFMPWTLFLPLVPSALGQRWREKRAAVESGPMGLALASRRGPFVFLLVWIALVLGPYSMAASKRGVYLLGLYPALALLLGWAVNQFGRSSQPAVSPSSTTPSVADGTPPLRAWSRVLAVVALAISALAAFLAAAVVVHGGGMPLLNGLLTWFHGEDREIVAAVVHELAAHAGETACLFFAAALALVVAAAALREVCWRSGVVGMLAATALLTVLVEGYILPAVAESKTRRGFVEEVRAALPSGARLFSYRHFDYAFVFYWGERVPVYEESLSAAGPHYLLISAADWQDAGMESRQAYEAVPGLRAGTSGNMGRLLVLRRIVAGTGDESRLPIVGEKSEAGEEDEE